MALTHGSRIKQPRGSNFKFCIMKSSALTLDCKCPSCDVKVGEYDLTGPSNEVIAAEYEVKFGEFNIK